MKFKDTTYGDLTGTFYDESIYVGGLGLTSLEGSPKVVNGTFDCSNNQLTSLEFSPEEVDTTFDCSNNQLTSLEGSPKVVSISFDCSNNQLTSLESLNKKTKIKLFHFDSNPNKHLKKEYKVRKNNPTLSEYLIKEIMYELTNDDIYLPEEIQDIFIF